MNKYTIDKLQSRFICFTCTLKKYIFKYITNKIKKKQNISYLSTYNCSH